MRRLLGCLLAVLLVGTAQADVKISGDVKVRPYRQVRLSIETPGKDSIVAWDTWPRTIDPVDPSRLGESFIFTAEPGTYEVQVLVVGTSADGKKSVERGSVTVVISESAPPADDVFLKALKKAYGEESDEDKAALKTKLSQLYRQSASEKILSTAKTGKALFLVMSNAASTLGISGKLKALQEVIDKELKARLKLTEAQELDDALRKTITEHFLNIANTLDKVQ